MTKIKGSEKLAHGYSALTVAINTGAKAAQADIPLPTWAKGAQEILQAEKVTLSDGTATGAHTTLTVVDVTPAAGEILLYDEDNVRCGDATTALDHLILALKYKSFQVNLE